MCVYDLPAVTFTHERRINEREEPQSQMYSMLDN